MLHRRFASVALLLLGFAAPPVVLLAIYGHDMYMPPTWLHFYGVGLTALTATVAAVALTTAGVRIGDARTVLAGGGFSAMAALLAVHGLTTPGVLVGSNSVIAIAGGTTLPVGGAILALSGWSRLSSPSAIRPLLYLQAGLVAVVVGLSAVALLEPDLVPAIPRAKSPEAYALLILGLALYGLLLVRAARTFYLTRRGADIAVVFGLVLLASALYGALVLTGMDLGWWLGHLFEVVGVTLVGGAVAYDLQRGGRSRPLVGDLRAAEIVAAEEAYLGARVRSLMMRLAEKDISTEEHTRRVASLAVSLGEVLGLPSHRLRNLAVGGLLHDIGKLSVPTTILQKPASLTDHEYDVIKRHPERGSELLAELGGFERPIRRLVLDHHERLDGRGYPRGKSAEELDLETRILTVCDVYDALVSPRVYRSAWAPQRALALLREQTGAAFDSRCVDALVRVLEREGRSALPRAS